jgi:peptidoglycan/LPS O-acetylase OafA/YrhL
MVAVTLLAAFFILDSIDLKLLAEASISHLFCASNFYFASSLGYFSGASELYPLLHT